MNNLLVFGVPREFKKVENIPEGRFKTRIRFREGKNAIFYLNASDGIMAYTIFDRGDHWELGNCVSCNITNPPQENETIPNNIIHYDFRNDRYISPEPDNAA